MRAFCIQTNAIPLIVRTSLLATACFAQLLRLARSGFRHVSDAAVISGPVHALLRRLAFD